MAHQTPALGRMVIYRRGSLPAMEGATQTRAAEPSEHPAVITRVWANELVNLHVFFDGALSEPRTFVSMIHDDCLPRETPGWRWPVVPTPQPMPSPMGPARQQQTDSGLVQGLTRKGTPASQKVRPPPPMREVVEGWLGRREEKKSVDQLENHNRSQDKS